MSKPVISVTCYQLDGITHNPPLTIGVPVNSKTLITPVTHPSPNWDAGVGPNGERPNPEVAPYVYACIAFNTPSNAGSSVGFVSQTVAALIADINS